MNLGLVIIALVMLGYISNWLNWRFLNYKITHLLYYFGALVHESSHALLCILTGAKIDEFSVFSAQPHVTHRTSKLPFFGKLFISFAPIAGGFFFLFVVNRYLLHDYFVIAQFFDVQNIRDVIRGAVWFVSQINPLEWQSWVMILLFQNIGAMIGPSVQDMKNIWPFLVIFFFVHSSLLASIGLMAIMFIVINIAVQLTAIAVLFITSRVTR